MRRAAARLLTAAGALSALIPTALADEIYEPPISETASPAPWIIAAVIAACAVIVLVLLARDRRKKRKEKK